LVRVHFAVKPAPASAVIDPPFATRAVEDGERVPVVEDAEPLGPFVLVSPDPGEVTFDEVFEDGKIFRVVGVESSERRGARVVRRGRLREEWLVERRDQAQNLAARGAEGDKNLVSLRDAGAAAGALVADAREGLAGLEGFVCLVLRHSPA